MYHLASLTQNQKELLSVYRDQGLAAGLSTEAIDRTRALAAVTEAYHCAGLPIPKIVVYLSSPLSGIIGAEILKEVSGQARDQAWDQVLNQVSGQVSDQIRGQVFSQVFSQVSDQIRDQVSDQVSGQVFNQAFSQAWDQVLNQVSGQARDQAWDQVSDQVSDQIRDQVSDQIRDQVFNQVSGQVSDQIRDQVFNQVFNQFGSQDAGWMYFYKYLRDISGGEICQNISGLVKTVQECGWWWPFENVVIITDRPCEMHRDAENRLHNESGPALLYRDGWGVYAIHGVRVKSWIVEHPDEITSAKIDSESNAEVRRVMIDRYGVSQYVFDSGALPIHADEFGTLYRRDVPDDEPIMLVHVLNRTPEPDGNFTRKQALETFDPAKKFILKYPESAKFKGYFLRVDPKLRPMLENNKFGGPQAETALNAVASTFGLTGEEYGPLVES